VPVRRGVSGVVVGVVDSDEHGGAAGREPVADFERLGQSAHGVPYRGIDERRLVPFAKAYSGLTDEEIRKVDQFIRRNTLEKVTRAIIEHQRPFPILETSALPDVRIIGRDRAQLLLGEERDAVPDILDRPLRDALFQEPRLQRTLDRFRDAHHQVFEFGESGHDRAEIVSFLGSVTDGTPPAISGYEGRNALSLALRTLERIREHAEHPGVSEFSANVR